MLAYFKHGQLYALKKSLSGGCGGQGGFNYQKSYDEEGDSV
jgi:hypothetical protein